MARSHSALIPFTGLNSEPMVFVPFLQKENRNIKLHSILNRKKKIRQSVTFFTFLIYLFIYFLTAFGLQCYACTNHPEFSGGTTCESDKAEKITCDAVLYNRCVTLKYTMSLGLLGSRSIEQRNCSNVLSCDPKYQFNSKCKNSYYLVEYACWYRGMQPE